MITSNHLKIGVQPLHLKILDEINAGLCDGLTYKEVDELYPMDANERKIDKLRYRYPRGESYLDLIQRVEPIIFEIERSQEPVIVVAHQAVVRCLYAYFSKNEIKDVPFISVPLNTVICLRPETYFCHEFRYTIDINTGGISEREDPKPLYVEDYRKVNT
jgi:broad specificity phosphatase PhoE